MIAIDVDDLDAAVGDVAPAVGAVVKAVSRVGQWCRRPEERDRAGVAIEPPEIGARATSTIAARWLTASRQAMRKIRA